MKKLKNSQNEYINLEKQVRELQDQIDKLKKNKDQVGRINKKLVVKLKFTFLFN